MAKVNKNTINAVASQSVSEILSIRSTHMVVRLETGAFGSKKRDRLIAETAEQKLGMAAGTAGGDKRLLPTDGLLQRIRSLIEKFRKDSYIARTLPWYGQSDNSKDGGRLCAKGKDGIDALTAAYNKAHDEWELLVQQFIDNYDSLVRQAKPLLAGAFNDADYPSKDEVKAKFKFNLEIAPLPNADDFRTMFSDEQGERLRAKFIADEAQRTTVAVRDLADRILDAATKVKGALDRQDSNDKSRLHESLLVNLREIADVIPGLNLLDDPGLNEVHARIKKINLTHETLKDDADERKAAAEQVGAVADVLKGLV